MFIQAIYPVYKLMKESSKISISSSFQLLLENSLEPSKTRKIKAIVRRGYPPATSLCNRQQQTSSDEDIWLPEQSQQTPSNIETLPEHARGKYPWTVFGLIALVKSGRTSYLGTGTIIGQKYILTARFQQLYGTDHQRCDLFFVPFFRRDPSEKYAVQEVFPFYKFQDKGKSHVYSTSDLKIAILQLKSQSLIQQKYGSIGHNFNYFQNNPHSRLFIAGIHQSQSSQEILVMKGKFQTGEQIQYEQIFKWNCGRGSPMLYQLNGELFICGVQVDCQVPNRKRVIKLTKEIFNQKLNKFTFQGYELDLSQNILKQRQINYLKQISLKKAVAMDLQATQIGVFGLKALNKCRVYNLLESINLNNNKLTDDCIEQISSASWKNLTQLSACKNNLTSRAMMYLSLSTWKNLYKLELNNNLLGTKGIQYLSKADWLLLQTLYLESTQIDSYACEKLRKARFPNLKELVLRKNHINSSGIKWLLQGDWQQLKYLDLGKNGLREEGVRALLKANWTKLHILRLEFNLMKAHNFGVRSKLKQKFKRIMFV